MTIKSFRQIGEVNARSQEMVRDRGDGATPTTSDDRNSTATASHINALIVCTALWGRPPIPVAEWIIRRFNLGGAR